MEDSHGLLPAHPAVCRFQLGGDRARLGWWDGKSLVDLSATAGQACSSLGALLAAGTPLGTAVAQAANTAPRVALDAASLLSPIDAQEVWAAGVTYERSRAARMTESEYAADAYWRVYDAERPELFYKGDARRTSGPGGMIRVHPDSRWTVPEPELVLVIDPALRIAGYTIGNDVSARDIEGENPLYLPQAKVYLGSCALGPWIVPAEAVPDPYDLTITCSIARGGSVIWRDETSTGQLHRRLDDLARYLGRANTFPDGVFLMSGTCLVPPESLTLEPGDQVEIAISELGVLRNEVA